MSENLEKTEKPLQNRWMVVIAAVVLELALWAIYAWSMYAWSIQAVDFNYSHGIQREYTRCLAQVS